MKSTTPSEICAVLRFYASQWSRDPDGNRTDIPTGPLAEDRGQKARDLLERVSSADPILDRLKALRNDMVTAGLGDVAQDFLDPAIDAVTNKRTGLPQEVTP